MRGVKVALLAVTVAVATVGCGRFRIRPPSPSRQVVLSGFEVLYDQRIPRDRQRLLDRLRVPEEMTAALRASYPAGPGPFVRVVLTQFRAGRWGPTRMHAVAQVLGPAQNVLAQIEADATSVYRVSAVRGASRTARIQRVAQAIVDQLAQQL